MGTLFASRRKRWILTAVVVAGLAAAQAYASGFIGVQVPGATGDATLAGFAGQIAAESVSWGFKNNAGVVIAPIVVTKRLDGATTALIQAGASAKILPTVTISHVTLGGPNGTLAIPQTTVLTNAKVVDFQMLDSVDGGPPVESVTFTAQAVTFNYVTATAAGALNKPSSASVSTK